MDSDRGKRYGTDQTNTARRSSSTAVCSDVTIRFLKIPNGQESVSVREKKRCSPSPRNIVDARGDLIGQPATIYKGNLTNEHAAPVFYESHLFVIIRLLDEIMGKVNPAGVAKTWTHDMYEETAGADR